MWLGALRCSGAEEHLALCQFSAWGDTTCAFSREDAGVSCNAQEKGACVWLQVCVCLCERVGQRESA